MQNLATFKPLTNRAADAGAGFELPADGFVQLVPKGEAPNLLGEKRIIQVVDDEALQNMRQRLLQNSGAEMLIDEDHFSRDQDKSTQAQGWQLHNSDTLVIREDGLYGSPRWSTIGEANLKGGVFRYISPEFDPATVQPLGGNRYRVTGLVGLALTNRPNFKRMKPLTNRDADDGIDNPTQHTHMKALLAAHLGITETALEALAEDALKNRLSEIKTKADKASDLETELTTLKNSAADEFITQHDKVIPKDQKVRDHLKQTFLANRETAQVIVDGFTAAKGSKADDGLTDEQRARAQKKPLFNRDQAETPSLADNKKAAERAGKVRARAQELCNREKGLGWSSAWSRAESEIPAA